MIDSDKGELHLLQEKLSQLQELIEQWRGCKACRKRELLSLIGSLSHACKVIWADHIFLIHVVQKQSNHIFLLLSTDGQAPVKSSDTSVPGLELSTLDGAVERYFQLD